MYQVILFFHVFAAVCIIGLVLIQQGRGASVGAAFGSGASQTVFGSRGSGSFLFRLTMGLIAVFFITSISMNYMAMRAYKQAGVINLPAKQEEQVPNVPSRSEQAPAAAVPAPVLNIPAQGAKPTLPATDAITPAMPNKQETKQSSQGRN